MYQHFYGLRELPFALTPNPKYLYLTAQHREALSMLQYGLVSSKGMTVLIGEAGTGKTTLLHGALQAESCRHVKCVHVLNPRLTRDEFIEMLSAQFDLSDRAARSKAALLSEFEVILRERRARGEMTALVVDEAQSVSGELLEEIRLLANIETTTEKLVSIVLAGQPELRDRLNENALRQLKQRVTLRCQITPFNLEDTAQYIASRIRSAGGNATKIFSLEAVVLIHRYSGGIPRTISVMCDNALLSGFGLGRPTVDSHIVLDVARDLDLLESGQRDLGVSFTAEHLASSTRNEGASVIGSATSAPAPTESSPAEPPAISTTRTLPRLSVLGIR